MKKEFPHISFVFSLFGLTVLLILGLDFEYFNNVSTQYMIYILVALFLILGTFFKSRQRHLVTGPGGVNVMHVMGIDYHSHKGSGDMESKTILTNLRSTDSDIPYDPVTENMPNVFFSLDTNMRYLMVNRAYEKFTGMNIKQVIGKSVAEIIPGNLTGFWTEYKEVLETGMAKTCISQFLLDGRTSWYMVNIFPVRNGLSVVMTDITEQKKLEKEAKEENERLKQKNKDLQQFTYVLSHNLRTPIAKILGLVSLYEHEVDVKIDNVPVLTCVANELNNLDTVIQDVNTIMAARNSGELQKDHIAFSDQLKLILQVLDVQVKECNAKITSDFKPDGIHTVKGYLYSIIYNLVSNAIKYRSSERNCHVHLQTREDDRFVILSVKDNGSGIDMKRFGDKIFGLYKRFHGSEIEGKGIGLNLVKSQVESLGGKVEVKSKLNTGTTFIIYLPKESAHAASK